MLLVLETGRNKTLPKISIFPPNPSELKEHERVSIVCIASDFYPEHVRLRWKVDGEVREGGVQSTPWKTTTGYYSTSSRLSLTKKEYYNSQKTFQCRAGFGRDEEKDEVSKEIEGEPGCSMSPNMYRRYMNNGMLSYLLILCKSALYGVIVAAVVLRRKAVRDSC
ncbi:hypothetical protein FKM82_014770 [Ascaphus truei]